MTPDEFKNGAYPQRGAEPAALHRPAGPVGQLVVEEVGKELSVLCIEPGLGHAVDQRDSSSLGVVDGPAVTPIGVGASVVAGDHAHSMERRNGKDQPKEAQQPDAVLRAVAVRLARKANDLLTDLDDRAVDEAPNPGQRHAMEDLRSALEAARAAGLLEDGHADPT